MSFVVKESSEDGIVATASVKLDMIVLFLVISIFSLAASFSALHFSNYPVAIISGLAFIAFVYKIFKGVYESTATFDHATAKLNLFTKTPKKETSDVFSYTQFTANIVHQKNSHFCMIDLPGLSKDMQIAIRSKEDEENMEAFIETFKRRRKEEKQLKKETRLLDKILADTKVPKSVGGSTSMAVPASIFVDKSPKTPSHSTHNPNEHDMPPL